VYQDDLLMMANKLAGYTWGEVDKFRKAVGKKIPAEMAAQKENLLKAVSSTVNGRIKKPNKFGHGLNHSRRTDLTSTFRIIRSCCLSNSIFQG